MKKFTKTVALTVSLMLPLSAHAVWKCEATSPSAYGVGLSNHLGTAQQIALVECSKRTPTFQNCYLVDCWWLPNIY